MPSRESRSSAPAETLPDKALSPEQIGFDEVDLASSESFPASDPPPWTLGVSQPTPGQELNSPRASDFRIERDSMGEVRVPSNVLYGAQTQRAVENFPIGRYRFQPSFIKALALVKACAARANADVGVLPPELALAIANASDAIAAGAHYDQFVVDVFQTGSGTSTNMNANEVIARLAKAHPNDHVNKGQSSNDVIPATIHVASAVQIQAELLPAMKLLESALERKSSAFWEVIKIGRTHLQDATPMRLGQEFEGYAHQVKACSERRTAALDGLYELPLGGTAIGTGVNAPPGFANRTIDMISRCTGLPFREARNHFEAQAAKDAVLFLSGALKTYSIALTKIANDLRWLASGPRGGIAEIRLPPLQPGSSIMPGKVNPVIPESVLMICAQVIGHDAAITWGCASGNFELNTMMPLIAYDLLDSIELLSAGTRNLTLRCVDGLEANPEKAGKLVEQSLAMATPLANEIGYDKAAAIAKEAFDRGRTVREVAIERSGLPERRVTELLEFLD
ncbi:MAG: class II fumarate hydratase [Anaerolineales bacterium]|nr:class II fumarate hydratase [Anaerolineales bacterium]